MEVKKSWSSSEQSYEQQIEKVVEEVKKPLWCEVIEILAIVNVPCN